MTEFDDFYPCFVQQIHRTPKWEQKRRSLGLLEEVSPTSFQTNLVGAGKWHTNHEWLDEVPALMNYAHCSHIEAEKSRDWHKNQAHTSKNMWDAFNHARCLNRKKPSLYRQSGQIPINQHKKATRDIMICQWWGHSVSMMLSHLLICHVLLECTCVFRHAPLLYEKSFNCTPMYKLCTIVQIMYNSINYLRLHILSTIVHIIL